MGGLDLAIGRYLEDLSGAVLTDVKVSVWTDLDPIRICGRRLAQLIQTDEQPPVRERAIRFILNEITRPASDSST